MRAGPGPVVVMGVSASGKSTVGARLARRLGVPFVDADDLHPQANVDKMRSGHPLDDADREPWLDRVGATLAESARDGIVVACSSLRRAYRDRIRRAAPTTRFVHLHLSEEALAERAGARLGHFMPATLLASQLATLEPPAEDEPALTVDADEPVDEIVDLAAAWLVGGPDLEVGAARDAPPPA
ncbi:gluconokinase [Agromyces luteolus]|uniref:Gluconokinase n=1 Tax=Agromyces luteolus TaxID=88373 RepID=A0A7C9HIF5_9MICO|nr:gluconokinase [Agromyces luteolus]MUN07761.1 AAA family ATPase [Agromyces luteolus]GLK27533.1 gluconokinase [Agromyces luteolus]